MLHEKYLQSIHKPEILHKFAPSLDLKEREFYILSKLVDLDNLVDLDPLHLMFISNCLDTLKPVDLSDKYLYITERTGTKEFTDIEEWHLDGFSRRIPCGSDTNFVWCSNNAPEFLQKEVFTPKGFDGRIHNINNYLNALFPNAKSIDIITAPAMYICKFNSYAIHRKPSFTGHRCFLRLSILDLPIKGSKSFQDMSVIDYRTTLEDFKG